MGDKSGSNSLLFLIFPGFQILVWTFQPIGSYAALLALGTLLLLVESLQPRTKRMALIRDFGLGLVVGLGLWANQRFIIYILAVFIPKFMISNTWKNKYSELKVTIPKRLALSLNKFLILSFVLLFGLGTLAFFSSGCEPRYIFIRVGLVAKVILAAYLLLVFIYTFGKRATNANSVMKILAFCSGTVVGYSPQWLPRVFEGLKPGSVIAPSCPIAMPSRLVFIIKELLPAMWGFATETGPVANTTVNIILWGFVGLLTITALAWFMVHHRETILSSVRVFPLDHSQIGTDQVLMIFFFPIVLSILGSNTVDIYSVRHLLVSWHARAILFAVFLTKAFRRRSISSWLIALAWVIFVGVTNLFIASRS